MFQPVQLLILLLCLGFAYTIGFQDGSSVTASAMATRSMTSRQTVLLVAVFEFLGAVFGGSAVAASMLSITRWPEGAELFGLLASTLTTAIIWNSLTRRFGVPSSSSHTLIGSIMGGAVAGSQGMNSLLWGSPGYIFNATGLIKVLLSLFVSPLLGFGAGFTGLLLLSSLLRGASSRLNQTFNRLEWISIPALAFGHGANSSQKIMAVMVLALLTTAPTTIDIPLWVRLATALAISLGIATMAPRIVRRVGGIFKQRPIHGIVTSSSSALVVLFASLTGGPICTSQVVASTIIGVGSAERFKGVYWQGAVNIVRAWLITIPTTAIVSYVLRVTIFSSLR